MYELQRKLTWSTVRAAAVVTLATVLLSVTVFFSGNINEIFSKKSSIMAVFRDVQGLRTGAPIWIFGYEIGSVRKINIVDGGANVELSINHKYLSAIHGDARAVVMTMGILGDKYIEIQPGDRQTALIEVNDTIAGINTVGFEQIMASASEVMLQLDSTMQTIGLLITSISDREGSLGRLINDPELYKSLTLTTQSLAEITNRFNTPEGTFWRFMKDSTLYSNLNYATEQFISLLHQIDGGLDNGGMAGALVNDSSLADNVRQTILSVKSSSDALNSLINEIRKNPRKYFNIKLF